MRGCRKFVVLVLVGAVVSLGSLAQVPIPPAVVTPPDPEAVLAARISEMLAKGPEYFAIAERANRSLSSTEKARLAGAIGALLGKGEALLGGPKAPPTVMVRIPPELDDGLRSIVKRMAMDGEEIIGSTYALALGILRPVMEVVLEPPRTHWTCYYSYVYAYWTYICAYWTYICYDTALAYYTLVYAYYSYVYAYYCYLRC